MAQLPQHLQSSFVGGIPLAEVAPFDLRFLRQPAVLDRCDDSRHAAKEVAGSLRVTRPVLLVNQAIHAIIVVGLVGDLVREIDQAIQQVFTVGIGHTRHQLK